MNPALPKTRIVGFKGRVKRLKAMLKYSSKAKYRIGKAKKGRAG